MDTLINAENKVLAGIIDRMRKDRSKLKKILGANDNRLDKSDGRSWDQLQERVDKLQAAYDTLGDAISDLSKL